MIENIFINILGENLIRLEFNTNLHNCLVIVSCFDYDFEVLHVVSIQVSKIELY